MPNTLKTLKPYALLLIIAVIAYLPVSTFYFGMKNDAFADNFPNKFFISEALHSGHLPLWNPYLNYGFPVYADMGVAFYNPITWLFAFIGYNAYTLTLEVLLYIYLGGVFMYRLGRYLTFSNSISITIAVMYICSGFYTGSMEYINFLTAAAFLPLVVQALLQLLNGPSFKTSFILAIAVYFVFAGGHPAIPIMLIYFIAVLLVLAFAFNKQYRVGWKKVALFFGAALALFAIFYLPAIYSYITILPHYARSTPEAQYTHTDVGFTYSSYLSFIYPFATGTHVDVFGTDLSMRNGFFSVAGIICVLGSIKSRQQYTRLFLITGCIMLLFSAGGPIKAIIFKLPLLQFIRSNGEYRAFALVCFCALAGFGLQRLATSDINYKKYFVTALRLLLGISAVVFLVLIIFNYHDITVALQTLTSAGTLPQKVKGFLASPFAVLLLVSTVITAVVCVLSIRALKANKLKLLLLITLADVCFNCAIYLPITGVGQTPLKSIQAIYNSFPKGIPVPPLTPVNTIPVFDSLTTGLAGDACNYNKKIGTTILTNYPSFFISTDSFFANKNLVAQVSVHPWLFIQQHDTSAHTPEIHRLSFDPQSTTMQLTAAQDDTLVFLQNNYTFWHAAVNDKEVPVNTAYTTFMSVKLDKGLNSVMFYYTDPWLGRCCLVSLLAFLTTVVIVYKKRATYK